jgi:hypothetical protein
MPGFPEIRGEMRANQACRWRGATLLAQALITAEVMHTVPSTRTFAHLRKRISSAYGMR